MTRLAERMLALCLAALGVTVAAELAAPTVMPEPPAAHAHPANAGARATAPQLPDTRTAAADAIAGTLARPLFAPTRRPPAVAAPASRPMAAVAQPLPRLSGIMITGGERRAIFAVVGTPRPLTVLAGGQVGGFTVETIETDRVVLRGADGPHELSPSYVTSPNGGADVGTPSPASFLIPSGADSVADASQPASPGDLTRPAMRRFTRGSAARIASNPPEIGR